MLFIEYEQGERDPDGFSTEDYTAVTETLSADLVKASHDKAKYAWENWLLAYDLPKTAQASFIYGRAQFQGALVWAVLNGWMTLTEKALKALDGEAIEAQGNVISFPGIDDPQAY